MKLMKASAVLASIVAVVVSFQNCAPQDMRFSQGSLSNKFGLIQCANFESQSAPENCLDSKNGLVGRLYYLLDKSERRGIDSGKFYDKDDNSVSMGSITSVDVLMKIGFQSEALILTKSISTPTISFKNGFSTGDGQFLKDHSGQALIEAFAMDFRGKLKLTSSLRAGRYELGILSDDGAIVEIDTDGNGTYDFVVNNDGQHAPQLACSKESFFIDDNSRLPIRIRYYQGPRTQIALTLVMRPIQSLSEVGSDADCGFLEGQRHYSTNTSMNWFGDKSSNPGYVPNYTTSVFGKMLERGWFIPTAEMFDFPDQLP